MTREDEILNSMREQREDAYRDGLEQGREQERVELACRMIAAGMDVRQVADLTGLGIETIQEVLDTGR